MMLDVGSPAPLFDMPTDGGGRATLTELKGKTVVLYFYPRDDTPGCTKQACAFRDNLPDFTGVNAVVIGVSRDDEKKHDKFKAKYELTFPLAADIDGACTEAYGVWVEKSMYGKTYMGIERATYLIDGEGVIQKIWRKVKVPGHVEQVLDAVKALG